MYDFMSLVVPQVVHRPEGCRVHLRDPGKGQQRGSSGAGQRDLGEPRA